MAVRTIALDMSTNKIADVLGVMGENEATELRIDCADVLDAWPGAVLGMAVLRPTETTPYAAFVGQAPEGGVVSYLLTSTETAVAGTITLMVTATVNGRVCKSALYKSRINRAIGDVGADPEAPNPDWMATLLENVASASASATAAAGSATAAAGSATGASASASAAAGSATAAAGSATDASGSAAAAATSAQGVSGAVQAAQEATASAEAATAAATAAAQNAVLTAAQTLTAEQQTQARSNIGLGTAAVKGVSNALTQTADGYVLDARQGKALSDAIAAKAAPATDTSATLTAAGWTGTAAPYTQTVAVADLSATAKLTVGLAATITAAQYEAAAAAMLLATAQAAGSVTVSAFGEKPTVDVPIAIREVG